MKIEEKWVYPASDDAVYAMIVDPAFQEAKCVATKAVEHSVEIEPDGGGHTVVTHRTMSTASFPSQFKSMIGDSLKITETQAWGAPDADGVREAQLSVVIAGVPIALTGTITATPSGTRGKDTVMDVAGNLKARIPLIGGKIEQAAAPAIVSAVRSEAETGKEYLAR
ncbi:DUF2505 domain-containing protein [Allobranchiibius sp. GilTou38]|uniref:DUF2505 domain-containing protein n=1 Tax=Allobranchiibius sp. GilTou38 TaxID=2815210 RepID=UPI001AA0B29B|nr:DUF2505 domain-containing protein [Allobranchiibius sp. GilTou38]MBO1765653.1 DUF2505 domain-containing protein [Allobranchiibius sp. GilTou38]